MKKVGLLSAVLLLVLAGCEDPFGPNQRPLPLPALVTTWDFEAHPLRKPSAFDMESGGTARITETSRWDFLYSVPPGESPELRPRAVVVGDSSAAGLQRVEVAFDSLTEAPEEGYVTGEPVPVDSGAVFAARSRQDDDFQSLRCRRFGKLEIVSIDRAAGTVTFRQLVNPNCEERKLSADSVPGG